MRIKKKDVLTEALLIDVTSEFTPLEKKIFRIFRKKYGDGGYASGFDRWDAAAWLIENMAYDHDQAYDLALTYWYNGNKLFDEVRSLRKKENRGYIFNRALNKFTEIFKDEKGENYIGQIPVSWEDPNNLMSNGEKFISNSDAFLWTSYRGFNIYVPFDNMLARYGTSYEFRETTTIFGRIQYREVGKEQYDHEDEDNDYNKFYEVAFILERKNIAGENETIFEEIERKDIPSPINKNVIYDVFVNDINKMVNLIKKRTFILPENDTQEE